MVLQRYKQFTREEVHDIFEPKSKFVSGTGSWGLQGIVKIRDTDDYVFFVSIGSKQGTHIFEEGITKKGVLNWQSQPKQSLSSVTIQKLIRHNNLLHNIYLFYRPNKQEKTYIYLGTLSYISHDKTRSNPVYFQWQIQDWDPPKFIQDQCISSKKSELEDTTNETPSKNIIRSINFDKRNKRNKEIGTLGEDIVLHYEKEVLLRANKKELADKVTLTKDFLGNTAAYDIHSYTIDGQDKYIEVKTTTGDNSVPFYLSIRERAFAIHHKKNYYLYRIYNLDREANTGALSVYQDIESLFEFEANNFSVKLKTPASS